MDLAERLKFERAFLHRFQDFRIGAGVRDKAAVKFDVGSALDHVLDVLDRAALIRTHVLFADRH